MTRPTRAGRVLAALTGAALTATLLGGPPAQAEEPAPPAVADASHAYGAERAKQVVEQRTIGRSVRGRAIVAYRKGNPAAKHTVLLLGQMHGDEPAGPRTVRALLGGIRVDSDTDLWLVPTMNPDGAARGTRKNARGVDLNRNWPTSGWRDGDRRRGSRDYRGPKPASEPETRALMAFLTSARPDLVSSVHQPLAAIGRTGAAAYLRRLSRQLGLPIRELSVGTSTGRVSPTLTGWYGARYRGSAVTVEYAARPSTAYVTQRAPNGLLRASLADW